MHLGISPAPSFQSISIYLIPPPRQRETGSRLASSQRYHVFWYRFALGWFVSRRLKKQSNRLTPQVRSSLNQYISHVCIKISCWEKHRVPKVEIDASSLRHCSTIFQTRGATTKMTAAVIIRPGVNPGPHRSILVTPSCSKTSRLGERNPGPTKRRLHARVIKTVHSRRERPCDACRKRKSRCVIHDGALLCVLCDFHKQDCTFVEAPQPRKRKSETDEHKSVKIKKKYV